MEKDSYLNDSPNKDLEDMFKKDSWRYYKNGRLVETF